MTTIAPPDRQLVERLLARIESVAHGRGWDQPARLYLLCDARAEDTDQILRACPRPVLRVGHYAAAPMPDLPDGYASHHLFTLALNLRHSDAAEAEALLELFRLPGFLGLAMLFETWVRDCTAEEREALGPVRFADIPGSREARNVMAADVAGQDYFVSRKRGDAPTSDFAGVDGAVIESLRVITTLVADLPVPDQTEVPFGWQWPDEGTEKAPGS